MVTELYLYTPRGYSPGYIYKDFNKAVVQLLKDDGYDSLEQYGKDLDACGWWYDFDLEREIIAIDDGSQIQPIELIE